MSSSFFLLRGLRHPLLQNSCAAICLLKSDAESASTREARCSTFNDFFESELAFVAIQTPICFVFGQTELPFCSGARVQVRLARPRMIRLHTPAVDRKTRGRGTEKAACAQND